MRLLLDCSLGSVFDILHPRVGPGGIITGTPVFSSMRGRPGLDGASSENRVLFPDVIPHYYSPHTIEMWVKAKRDHSLTTTAYGMIGGASGDPEVLIPFHNMDDLDGANIFYASRMNEPVVFYVYWWTYLQGDIFHFAWSMNSAIGNQSGYARQVYPAPADRKIVAYKDGVPLAFHIANADDKILEGEQAFPIPFGIEGIPFYDSTFIVQDLKVWDGVKTDFSDRNNPRAGLQDQSIII